MLNFKLESQRHQVFFNCLTYFQFKINRIALVLSWKQTTVAILTIKFNHLRMLDSFGPFDLKHNYMNNVFPILILRIRA
jgi:hypothetical protein